jgi:hypothetical protein
MTQTHVQIGAAIAPKACILGESDIWFEFRAEHRGNLPQSRLTIAITVPLSDEDRYLPDPFQFIISLLSLFRNNRSNLMKSTCCLCVYMYIPLTLLENGLVNMFPRQRIHMQQHKICSTRRFPCGPCRIKRKYTISSSQNFLSTNHFNIHTI